MALIDMCELSNLAGALLQVAGVGDTVRQVGDYMSKQAHALGSELVTLREEENERHLVMLHAAAKHEEHLASTAKEHLQALDLFL